VVHSYPHVRFQPKLLPIAISDISALTLSAKWAIPAPPKDLETNIAWDLFADPEPATSRIDARARFEIMVWLGAYGDPKPIGFANGLCLNQTAVSNNMTL
jgi:xyloglucan-specific endo-beta-1,4-glucanase